MKNMSVQTADFVVRERYLNAIEAFIDKPVVKVLKGMRRVGKSVLMRLLIERLVNRGVPVANILYINKESLQFDELKDYRDLYRYAGNYFQGGTAATMASAAAIPAASAPASASAASAPASANAANAASAPASASAASVAASANANAASAPASASAASVAAPSSATTAPAPDLAPDLAAAQKNANFKDLTPNIAPAGRYILIDEIQEIAGWERAVTSFLAEGLGDVIISGSNARLLSSELATLISGRYVEIPVYPLTFREFLIFRHGHPQGKGATNTDEADAGHTDSAAHANASTETEFMNYLKYGGLPGIHQLPFNDEIVFSYLNSILNTVLYKDVVTRHKIRDVSIFDRLVRYLFDNVGNITTAKKIADYFKSQRLRTSVDTILNYINYIEASLLIDKVPRYDIKGKRLLEFSDKVFLNDIGLRHGLIGYRERDINGLLENIIYKELQARGYKISIGVLDQMEIDFIAEKQNDKKYIQVCYSLGGEAAIEREFGNLEKIRDNYEKTVVSMDRFFPAERNGVRHRHIIDFLLEQ